MAVFESRETIDPRRGIARNWRLGPLVIEWYVEAPPQDWLRFDGQCSVRWFADD